MKQPDDVVGSRTRVPLPMTSLIGRAREVEAVGSSLAQSRLVTISGPRGVGKSRVAGQVATTLERNREVVAWVDGTSGRDLEADARLLAGRRALLVLDQVDEGDAPAIESLLAEHPELRVLVTTRDARLGIAGERVHDLAALGRLDSDAATRSTARPDDAIALFIDRADDVAPGFKPTSSETAVIREICRLLAGIPAAIEATAAEHATFGLDSILDLLRTATSAEALRPLLGTYVDGVADDLGGLPEITREALARVCAYDGLLAHDCVDGRAGGDERALEVTRGFVELTRRHILIRGGGTSRGLSAYRVPWVVRVLESARVAAAGANDAIDRRTQHIEDVIDAAAIGWFGASQAALIDHLNLHRFDIGVHLDRMSRDPELAARATHLISSIRYYWRVGGLWRPAMVWLDRSVAVLPETSKVRARGLSTLAYLRVFENRALAIEAADEGVRIAESHRDDDAHRIAEFSRSIARLDASRATDGEAALLEMLERSRDTTKELGEQYYLLGAAALLRGDLDAAEGFARTSIAHSRGLNDAWGSAYDSLLLAVVHLRRRDAPAALVFGRELVDVFLRLGDDGGLRSGLRVLASGFAATGDPERAAVLLGAAHQLNASPSAIALLSGDGVEEVLVNKLGRQRVANRMAAGAALVRDEVRAVVQGGELPDDGDDLTLTSRERQIAALVSEGHQNGRIAEELVVSRRTVEGHVQRILSKLGFHSRSQIAVWYAEQRQQQVSGMSVLHALRESDSADAPRRR